MGIKPAAIFSAGLLGVFIVSSAALAANIDQISSSLFNLDLKVKRMEDSSKQLVKKADTVLKKTDQLKIHIRRFGGSGPKN